MDFFNFIPKKTNNLGQFPLFNTGYVIEFLRPDNGLG